MVEVTPFGVALTRLITMAMLDASTPTIVEASKQVEASLRELMTMTERRYSLSEIDRIRAGVQVRNADTRPQIWFECATSGNKGRIFPESAAALQAWEQKCEDQVRTCLLGGVDPNEFPPLNGDEIAKE